MVASCVLFEIQTELLNIIYTSFGFKVLINSQLYCNVMGSSIHDCSLRLQVFQKLQLTSINGTQSTLIEYLSEEPSYSSSLLHMPSALQDSSPQLI
jgi:hypothetical protein